MDTHQIESQESVSEAEVHTCNPAPSSSTLSGADTSEGEWYSEPHSTGEEMGVLMCDGQPVTGHVLHCKCLTAISAEHNATVARLRESLAKFTEASSSKTDWCPVCKQGWDCAKEDQKSRAENNDLRTQLRERDEAIKAVLDMALDEVWFMFRDRTSYPPKLTCCMCGATAEQEHTKDCYFHKLTAAAAPQEEQAHAKP